MQLWIGTSGYSYADWVGDFYPRGTRPERMLAYYCRFFPLVELNFTFYRLPTAPQLTHIAERTPERFQFLVKLPRSISHERAAREIPAFREALQSLRDRKQLMGLLCQLPQSFHHGKDETAWLERVRRELPDDPLAVEFRHRSWFRADVPEWLEKQRLELVGVDVPDIDALYPRGLVRSGPRVYVRLHSRAANNWYTGDKDRYDYDYGDDVLAWWGQQLRDARPAPTQAMLLFNNCHRAQAVQNAQRMRDILDEMAMPAIAPFGPPPEPRQRSLFD